MSTGILVTLAIAVIAAGLYVMLSEEIERVLAATVVAICGLVCLIAAPLPVQLLVFVGVFLSNRHGSWVE